MKKILKILFILAGTTTLPLSVVACDQESLNSNLNIIYKGLTKYDIEEFGDIKGKVITDRDVKKYVLSDSQVRIIAKKIVELNLKAAGIETSLN